MGPGTYVTFAPYDHRGYKGDFLTIRELRGGELHFRGYYRPTWPSNTVVAAPRHQLTTTDRPAELAGRPRSVGDNLRP